jgi:WD40 repeat protein
MNWKVWVIVLVAVFVVGIVIVNGTPHVRPLVGLIVDNSTGLPISGAKVEVEGKYTNESYYTDDKGSFFASPPFGGTYKITVNKNGYSSFRTDIDYSPAEGSFTMISLAPISPPTLSQLPLLWKYKVNGSVFGVSVSSDGSYVVAGSGDGNVYFFDKDGNLLWRYNTSDYAVWETSVSANGDYIAASSGVWGRRVHFLNRSGDLVWKYWTRSHARDISISSNGSYIVAGSDFDYFGNIHFLDNSGRWQKKYKTSGDVVSVSVSSDGSYIAVGSDDGNISLLDMNGSVLWRSVLTSPARKISIFSDGSLASVTNDGIFLYDRSGNLISLWEYKTNAHIFNYLSNPFEGNFMVAGSYRDNLYLMDNSGKILWRYRSDSKISDVDLSSNGNHIVAGNWDGEILFFDSAKLAEAMLTPTPKQPAFESLFALTSQLSIAWFFLRRKK